MANVLVVPEAQGGMGIQRLDQAPEYPAGGRLSELCNKLLESFPEVKGETNPLIFLPRTEIC